MTLRLRLVLAIVVLVAGGLALFGAATYTFYAHSEYQRLDAQIRSAMPIVAEQLNQAAGLSDGPNPGFGAGGGPPSRPNRGSPQGSPIVVPPGTYAELRGPDGTVLSHIQLTSAAQPRLPANLPAGHPRGPPVQHRHVDRLGRLPGPRNRHPRGKHRGHRAADDRGHQGPAQASSHRDRSAPPCCSSSSRWDRGWCSATGCDRSRTWPARPAPSPPAISPSGWPPPAGPSEVGQLGLALNTMLGRHRDRVRRTGSHRAAPAPVFGRRVPRAAHAADVDPGIRGAVPGQRRRRPRRPADDPAAYRRGVRPHEGPRRGPAAARPARPDKGRRKGPGGPRRPRC